MRGGLQRRTRSPPLLTFGTFGHAKVHPFPRREQAPALRFRCGFVSRPTRGENPRPLFLWKRRRKEKATKKTRQGELSPSAECDKGSAPLTAPPLKRRAKLLVGSAPALNLSRRRRHTPPMRHVSIPFEKVGRKLYLFRQFNNLLYNARE